MKLGAIFKECPEKVKRLKEKEKPTGNMGFSFYDYKNIMQHNSYERHNGAIRQIR